MLGQVVKLTFKKSRPKKNYGFIHGSDGEEYYFSLIGVSEDIKIGDEVSFRGERNEKGGFASQVRKIST